MSKEVETTAEQRAFAALVMAYRLAEQQPSQTRDLYERALHMADVLRARMEAAQQEYRVQERGWDAEKKSR
jgi:hypothetical protein